MLNFVSNHPFACLVKHAEDGVTRRRRGRTNGLGNRGECSDLGIAVETKRLSFRWPERTFLQHIMASGDLSYYWC